VLYCVSVIGGVEKLLSAPIGALTADSRFTVFIWSHLRFPSTGAIFMMLNCFLPCFWSCYQFMHSFIHNLIKSSLTRIQVSSSYCTWGTREQQSCFIFSKDLSKSIVCPCWLRLNLWKICSGIQSHYPMISENSMNNEEDSLWIALQICDSGFPGYSYV
jgi:hypothetical protein